MENNLVTRIVFTFYNRPITTKGTDKQYQQYLTAQNSICTSVNDLNCTVLVPQQKKDEVSEVMSMNNYTKTSTFQCSEIKQF